MTGLTQTVCSALAWLHGVEYPRVLLDMTWKQLLREFSVSPITTETGRRNGPISPGQILLNLQAERIDITAIKQCEE